MSDAGEGEAERTAREPGARFVCPCCGHRTLPESPGTVRMLCEVCAWEGRDRDGGFTSSGEPLVAGQRCFARVGACDPALTAFTRPARGDEARPPWWLPLDDVPADLLVALERAFASVTLAGGVSMAEADLIDEHALSSRDEHSRPPPGHGKAPPWQDLTLAGFERYHWGPFPFVEARGLRYYLPALLRFDLRGESPCAIESLVFCIDSGHAADRLRALLDGAQRRVVARWLLYRALVPSPGVYADAAGRALRRSWGEYLEPDERTLVGA